MARTARKKPTPKVESKLESLTASCIDEDGDEDFAKINLLIGLTDFGMIRVGLGRVDGGAQIFVDLSTGAASEVVIALAKTIEEAVTIKDMGGFLHAAGNA